MQWSVMRPAAPVSLYLLAGLGWDRMNGSDYLAGIAGAGVRLPSLLGQARRATLRPFVEIRVTGGNGAAGDLLAGMRGGF